MSGPRDEASGGRRRRLARDLALFSVKVLVATALITWLVRSGALDFSALAILVARPWLGVADLALASLWFVIATLRWRALLGLAGVEVALRRALHLQSAAAFFNVVIPGNVGGDVVKALYVAREAPGTKTPSILLVALVERVVGMIALLLLASLVVVARGSAVFRDPLLRPLGVAVTLIGAAAVIGPAIFIIVMRRAGRQLESWTSGPAPLSKLLAHVVGAMRLVTSRSSNLLVALGLSMAGHAAGMALFMVLTQAISGQDVPYASIATIFPLGILTLVLPISPAGIGVGHVAFDRLFAAAGLTGGATIFNVYLIGLVAPNLLGVLPYMALRRAGGVPGRAAAEAEPRR